MVIITGPACPIAPGDDVKSNLLPASARASNGAAPCSMNGNFPDLNVASAASLRSLTLTVSPASAKASTSGMPTWPAPPTTVMSALFALLESDGAVLVDAIFNWSPCRRNAPLSYQIGAVRPLPPANRLFGPISNYLASKFRKAGNSLFCNRNSAGRGNLWLVKPGQVALM